MQINLEIILEYVWRYSKDSLALSSKKAGLDYDMAINYGRRIRIVRKGLGIKQYVLAKQVGINKCYLSQIESGYRRPSLAVLERLCVALECELAIIIKQ